MAMEATRNKLAAQIIKAEMLDDQETVKRLKSELASLPMSTTKTQEPKSSHANRPSTSNQEQGQPRDFHRASSSEHRQAAMRPKVDNRVKKFIAANSSLSQMFVQEKSLTASDEARMFVKTASKFSRDDMETKYFSEEIDDSQLILNRSSKRHKQQEPRETQTHPDPSSMIRAQQESCDRCAERQARHLIVDESLEHTYLLLTDSKPFLSSTMSSVIIRNNDHSCNSFVSASEEHQTETEKIIDSLRDAWKSKGYRCIIMETYFKNRRPAKREPFISCSDHFQLHCLPIKEKYFERARMYFKQALQSCEGEWSMNRKLIQTEDRRIQRYLPKGLPYFWVCFDDLKIGFGHVIEAEQEFSRYFGLEIVSGLLDKSFNPMMLNRREEFKDQFERSRDFKLLYAKFKQCDGPNKHQV